VTSLPCRAADRPAYLEAMAREALAAGNAHGVLLLTAPDLVDVPAVLRRAEDGRNIYRPHIDERYTTEAHLASERRVVVGARQQTAPRLAGPELAVLRVELAARGLGEDQVAAVVGVLSSGRAGDVLIGPAGAGKSRTVAELAEVWTEQFGGRVVGLATSQKATQVLAEDGMEAINTSVFLHRFTPNRHGEAQDRVRPGDLFVVDEAGMASTDELARISRLVEAGGGKLLYTGDPHQLPAVGAGGLLDLLERDNGAFQLERVHRFRHDWERLASVRLRVGDTSVLREYEDRGRLHGGTVEEMQDAAVRGYLTDTMDGLDSLLIVGTNDEATLLSRQIRDRLVDLGKISPQTLATLDDDNKVSVGDMIQARKNDRNIDVDGGRGMVINRMTYTVRGIDDRGRVEVEGADGTVAHLPMSYVEEHVTLAYAVTTHSSQGLTVDTTHDLFDEHTTREAAYVPLTRGRLRNTAYLTTEREPDAHDVERLDTTPAERLAAIMANVGAARSAELERRTGQEEAHSLAWLGAQWDDVSAEYARDRYTHTLAALLPAEQLDALEAEPGYDRLLRAVRPTELAGHNAEAVLTEAVTARELHTADSVSNVLRARVRASVSHRTPEQHVDPHNWTTFAAPLDGPVGQFLQEMAVLASDRQVALGQRVAEELPEWAATHLGQPPEDPEQQQEWVRRAGVAAAYRELRGVPDDQVSLGTAPAHEQTLHRALWQQAHRALGQPADILDYYAASDAELRELHARWQREQTWAPAYVAKEMQDAYELAESYRQDAVLTTVELDTLPAESPEWEQLRASAARAERLAEDYTERARQLEEIHDAREQWFDTTEPARVADQLAGEELERRGLPARPEPAAEAEQLAFFDITREYDQVAREQDRMAEAVVEAEQQLAGDVEHGRPPSAEAEPAERVRWSNRWADRMAGRHRGADVVDHEVDHDVEQVEKATATGPEVDRDTNRERQAEKDQQREPERAEPEVDENQLVLVDVQPTVEDRVQAQPLRQAEVPAEQQRYPADDPDVEVTLAEARRQARAAELQRQQRETAEQRAAEQREQQRRAEAEAERERRDQAERDAKERAAEKDRERQAEKDQQREQERERRREEPQVELVQAPAVDWHPGGPGIG
jgi:AAA domain-containing protein